MGFNVEEMYQSESQWLKAADLPPGREVEVTICEAVEVDLDNKKKLGIKFQGKDKGMVLNKTNSMTIAHVYGGNTDDWMGKKIFLYSTKVDYAGQMVDAIRCRVALTNTDGLDDDIPF